MYPTSVRWRTTISYISLIALVLLWITVYTTRQVQTIYLDNLEDHIQTEAWLIAEIAKPLLIDSADAQALRDVVHQWAIVLGERITILGADGTVLAESHRNPAEMVNELHRSEIQEALERGKGSATRFSRAASYNTMYAAVAIRSHGEVHGFARLAVPLREFDAQVKQFRANILKVAALTILLAILLSAWTTQRIIQPIERLTRTAERVAGGDLSARIIVTGQDELAKLSRTFNAMADQLRDKVNILAKERRQLSAVLNNMADGVIITDYKGEVTLINPSAVRILQTTEAKALGRTFAQVVYHYQLIELWKRCHDTGEEQTCMVEAGWQELFIQAVITPLREANKQRFLIILQDLTRIRRLETIRRDFISNISHDLRTPLASLKVVVETLQDGAIEDPKAAHRFLSHIETEVNTLTQLVHELLELSRIESGKVPLELQPIPVHTVLGPAVERLRPQAERAGLTIALTIPPNLPRVQADSERLGQAVTNLLHNAIKFTPPGGSVIAAAEIRTSDEVVIAIKDTGVGIPEDDLPRIFERFYKADRARSSGGGTGLGLAIAKHIVLGHGGRIWAESRVGEGSTFYFTLKTAKQNVGLKPSR